MAAQKPDNTSYNANRETRVCFGYSTALEILRCVDTKKLVFARGNQITIPGKTPHKRTLAGAINQIEAMSSFPCTRKPVNVLVKNPVRPHSSESLTPHLCQAKLVYGSLYRLTPSIFLSSAPLAFLQIAAQEKDFIKLLQLGFEICGTYRTTQTSAVPAYQVPPLTSVRALRDFVDNNPSFYGANAARKALRYIADGSASPLETKLALLLGLPMSYGGYGLGIPHMNYEVEASSAAFSISGRKHLRCDLCWPKAKLDVEYQSREMHEGELSRAKDSRRANALSAMGWKCIAITNDEADSRYAMDVIAETIRKHIGKRNRVRVSNYHSRKLKLRMQLGLFIGNE